MPQDVINCLPGGPGGHAVRPTQRPPLQSSGKQPGRGLTPLFPPVGGKVDPGEKSRPLPPLPSVGAAWGSVWAGGPHPGWADVRADGKPPFPGLIPQLVTPRALWLPHPECEGREVDISACSVQDLSVCFSFLCNLLESCLSFIQQGYLETSAFVLG